VELWIGLKVCFDSVERMAEDRRGNTGHNGAEDLCFLIHCGTFHNLMGKVQSKPLTVNPRSLDRYCILLSHNPGKVSIEYVLADSNTCHCHVALESRIKKESYRVE